MKVAFTVEAGCRPHTAGLHVFCHVRGDASPLVGASMRRGVPCVSYSAGTDPSSIRWPATPLATVFEHDCLSDAELDRLIDAMLASGIRRVHVTGSIRRRSPTWFELK